MPKRYTCVKKIRLLTFGSVNYASTAGGYAAVTKGLITFERIEQSASDLVHRWRTMGGATDFKVGYNTGFASGASDKKFIPPLFQMWGTSKQISVGPY